MTDSVDMDALDDALRAASARARVSVRRPVGVDVTALGTVVGSLRATAGGDVKLTGSAAPDGPGTLYNATYFCGAAPRRALYGWLQLLTHCTGSA